MINKSNGEMKMEMTFAALRIAFTMAPLSVEVLEERGERAKLRDLRGNQVFWADKNNLENIRKIA